MTQEEILQQGAPLEPYIFETNREEQNIDWEQRRYEIAKQAMLGILSNEEEVEYACSTVKYSENEPHTIPKAISKFAVACADALIAELKGGE